MTRVAFTILGEPASKANSREIVPRKKRMPDGSTKTVPVSIKSEKAIEYERDAVRQIPPRCRVQLQGPVCVTLRIFYASERPDLDESVVLDVLQDRYRTVKRGDGNVRELVQRGVYINDRQVREKHVFHGIDKRNPRAEIVVEALQAQQAGLDLAMPVEDPLEVR
ncbi:RusA family crossover junction endodeoxyribonuclease [Paraburkholderia caribensis]|uniref:RusA family crossover junction endodeoxyribonuclease n=1 Tax=Paraburkholderia caribensis TaxID=75105 RepID=UPI001CB0AE97|nr:RusA family crossover junction endodeoxyribonuclease [Paraburkholderia caribensis]CAG9255921.1 Crossover junction endodeoxyribonuclease RuvA [Paraburkholderia caribensis]